MKNVYSVGQVNSYIKNMFAQDFLLQAIFVRGEVSNCKYHSSGHIYFTLKDAAGLMQCVMFASSRKGLQFQLREGQQIVVFGTIDVYERDGKYQLYAKEIVLDGAGALNEKFERLKNELEERGMFDACYKQPIPKFSKRIGVVTAPTGAAVQDIINISKRRNPYVQIILYPAIVQGDSAAFSIVNGIHALEAMQVDVIIVGRGGGSMEDLWAFNEEVVAQAIFDCRIPIISAVGHETDFTIADFVSDLRAPTPSAAAELAVLDVRSILADLESYQRRLNSGLGQAIRYEKARLEGLTNQLMQRSPMAMIRTKRTDCAYLWDHLQTAMQRHIMRKRHSFENLRLQMLGLSPLEKLNQGYSYVADEKGATLHSISQVKKDEEIKVFVQDGKIRAKVLTVESLDYGKREE